MKTAADILDDFISKMAKRKVEAWGYIKSDVTETATAACGSPLEELLYVGWELYEQARECDYGGYPQLIRPKSAESFVDAIAAVTAWEADIDFMWTQVPIDKYRADFAFARLIKFGNTHKVSRRLIVECDGHDFHERTKEQAAHDRARDRHFVERNIPFFRFTGSELWANLSKHIEQIECFLSRDIMDAEVIRRDAMAGAIA